MPIKDLVKPADQVWELEEVRSEGMAAHLNPAFWYQQRVPGAVITRTMNPDPPVGSQSAYVPFPVRRASDGLVLCYVKEESPEFRIVLHSAADAQTFSFVGTALEKGGAGTWDQTGVSEPGGYYDEDTDVIYLIYKGWTYAASPPGIRSNVGLAYAAATSPTSFTRLNGGSPILLQDTVAAALGIPVDNGVLNGHLYSEQLDNAAWTKEATTITANATTAPDGTATADKVIPSVAASGHYITQTLPTLSANTGQSLSLNGKPAGYDWLLIRILDKANVTKKTWVNLSTGALGTVASGHTVTVAAADAQGFRRVTLAFNSGTGATTPSIRYAIVPSNNTDNPFTGDGTSGGYLWGMQFQADVASPSPFYAKSEGTAGVRAPNVYDHAISSVIKIGTTWHAYGYIASLTEGYRIYRASGSSLTALTAQAIIISPPAGYTLAYFPSVFRHPTAPGYCMVYTQGVEIGSQSRYHLRCAWSLDGLSWVTLPGWFSVPENWQDNPAGFDARHYAGRFLMEGQDSDGSIGGLGGYDRLQQYLPLGAYLFYGSFSGSVAPANYDKVMLIKCRPLVGRDGTARNLATVYRDGTAQSIPNNSATDIQFSHRRNMRLDDMIHLDAVTTLQSTVTIREPGLYQIGFHVEFAASAGGTKREAYVVVGGTATPVHDIQPPAGASIGTVLRGTETWQMVGGETVTLRVFQDSGGALNASISNMNPTLEIRRLGD